MQDKDKSGDNLTNEEAEQNKKLQIDTKEFQDFIESKDLVALLKTIQGIKKAGYRNEKLVEELIKLTSLSDSDSKDLYKSDSELPNSKELDKIPSMDVLRNYLVEAAFLGDVNAISLLLSQSILKEKTVIETENGMCNINDIENKLQQRAFYKDQPSDISEMAYENYNNARQYNFYIYKIIERALYSATRKNHLEIVKILLDTIELDSYTKNVGIGYAKTKEMASIYLTKNADFICSAYWPNDAGILGAAVKDNNIELIDFLLENHACPLTSCNEISPLTYALEKMANEDPVIKEQGKQLLVKFAHHSPETFLISIALNDQISEEILIEAISVALKTRIININEQHEKDGWSALIVAADRLLYQVVVFLIEQGADISLTNHQNQTALNRAQAALDNYEFDVKKKEIAQSIVNLLEMSELMNKIKTLNQ